MADKSFLVGNIPNTPAYSAVPVSQTEPTFQSGVTGSPSNIPYLYTNNAPTTFLEGVTGVTEAAPVNLYTFNDTGTGSEVTLDFQSNILDNYDAYTYHFKLFITSTENARTGDIFSPANQVIIAESGVSDLTIDKVEFNAIAVPSVEAGTGTQTTVKFEIVEPSGAGLLDKLYYESVALGIGNWLVMPCYLELSFKARSPGTSDSDNNGEPGPISGLKWVWPIKLTNTKANVTTVGTRYEFDAIFYNELAQSNSYFAIQHNIVLKGVDTFQSAMNDLETKLNQDQFLKLIDNYSIPDSYRIVVDPAIANYKIRPVDDNKNSVRAGDYRILTDKTAMFNSGTGIDKIIDSLLINTEKYQVEATGAQNQTAGSSPGTINQDINQMKKFWRVTTETRPIAFDRRRQDNAVEITIFVLQYDLGVVLASPTSTGGTDGTIDASKRRLDEYLNKKILRKKYNYIFTGENDQIVTFDLNMNFSFAAALARFGGIYYSSSSKDIGPTIQHNAEEEANITEQVRKIISMQNDASTNSAIDQNSLKQLKSQIASSTLDSATKSRYTVLLEQSRPENRLTYINQARLHGINDNGTIDQNYLTAKSNATELATPAGNTNLKFISNVNLNSAATNQAYQDYIATGKGKIRPIAFREAPQEGASGQGVEATRTSGKNKLASLFSTALYSSLDASLMHIKLTIKGDPFWLFPMPTNGESKFVYNADLSVSEAIANLKGVPNSSVNFFGSDNFIIVRFRTPRIYNETTNPDNPDPFTEVETFSGVYRVLTIVSKFEQGLFKQELTCLLDPVINTSDFIKQIENNAANQDIPATASSLTGTPVPSLNVKTQRISSNLSSQFPGIVDTVRNSAGKVKDYGSLGAAAINQAKSNIPTIPDPTLIFQASNLIGPFSG